VRCAAVRTLSMCSTGRLHGERFPACRLRHDCACHRVAQFATEAAITVLRIDDMVRLEKTEDDMEG
jgi:hypothetical protein